MPESCSPEPGAFQEQNLLSWDPRGECGEGGGGQILKSEVGGDKESAFYF